MKKGALVLFVLAALVGCGDLPPEPDDCCADPQDPQLPQCPDDPAPPCKPQNDYDPQPLPWLVDANSDD